MDAMSDPLLRCGLHEKGEFPTLARYFRGILDEYFSDQQTLTCVIAWSRLLHILSRPFALSLSAISFSHGALKYPDTDAW